jgi:predicted nucleic acid-binding protein
MPQVSKKAVVDASVVLKWQFDDEECISQAIALRDDFYLRGTIQVIAPQLLIFEIANGITVAARMKRISQDKAAEALNNLLALNVEIKIIEPLLILELSLRYRLSAYDAAYVALARAEKCELWTGDKAFYKIAKDEPLMVKWIGDYKGS